MLTGDTVFVWESLQSVVTSPFTVGGCDPRQDTKRVAFGPAQVLRITDDVRDLRDGLRSGQFGLRMNRERVFSCAYQEPLIGAMACLDEPYVEEFGVDAMCDAQKFKHGCGPVGICCCWPFWGWGEKLQYFTGVPWDLPCNCGLSVCEAYEREQSHVESCCRHTGSTALFPVTDPGVFYCKGNGSGLAARVCCSPTSTNRWTQEVSCGLAAT